LSAIYTPITFNTYRQTTLSLHITDNMRFSSAAAIAVATSFAMVAAQDLSSIPTCAVSFSSRFILGEAT
jgi:hypothetical protein